MTKTTRNDRSSEPSCRLLPSMPEAFDDLRMSVDRFRLLAGLESLNEMMSADAEALCGSRHARSGERKGHRWGTTRSEIADHGGKVKGERPRVDETLHAGVRKVLRQAWRQDDAAKAERLLRNLARRLEHDAPGVSGSILEGLDEILTVIRLGLPPQLRRSLACTNAIENAIGTVRTVQRNVKRWRNAEMALRWTAAGLLEAQKTFRRLKAYRQLPILDAALREAVRKAGAKSVIEDIEVAA